MENERMLAIKDSKPAAVNAFESAKQRHDLLQK